MSHHEEQHAIAREIGQKIQECRVLAEKLDGGSGVSAHLNKVFEKVCKWLDSQDQENS